MTSTPLGPGREFDRIRIMASRWKERARGLGDDCAILEVGGDRIAVSIDVSVEGVHFRRDWMSPAEIGYRAAAAALADLAPPAPQPMAVLLTIRPPPPQRGATLAGLAARARDPAAHAPAP